MRETRINVLYYPDMVVTEATLKKAILLFDELHFMDRPSFSFGDFGLVGAPCPLRQIEDALREAGVPLFVHDAPGGPVKGELLEQVKADINDPLFLKRFQDGLKTSFAFRQFHIPVGNYGPHGDEIAVAEKVIAVDLSTDLKGYEKASDLVFDKEIRPIDLSTSLGCAKNLIMIGVTCSAKLNFALDAGAKNGFFPMADAKPYGDLLGAKYARAISKLEPVKNKIEMTDLSFAIFDELIPSERLIKLTLEDLVNYRKKSEGAREDFLEYLSTLQAKQASIGVDGDYSGEIQRLMVTEIVPAARNFRNKLDSIGDSLFGAIAKGAAGFIGSSSAISIFGDLSWERIVGLAGMAAAYLLKTGIDGILADRAARRECSISYILSLDE